MFEKFFNFKEHNTSITGETIGGLTTFMTMAYIIIALLFFPLVQTIGGGIVLGQTTLYPITAPALIIVGTLMMSGVTRINRDDSTEAIPAFLTIVIMPYAYSITEGIAVGFIFHTLLKFLTGKIKKVHPVLIIFAILFILRYIFLT